jgi:acetyl-CoA carboxylase biotin carboxyl carrier protein
MADEIKKPATAPDAASAPGVEVPAPEVTPVSAETASLLGLIDKLNALLEKSELSEMEVEAGQSSIVLRKPAALLPVVAASAAAPATTADPATVAAPAGPAVPVSSARAVRAPLTGIFYSSSSPSTPAYVTVGQDVVVGQVIGLIEAMKLFNEIKSDAAGKVVRIVAESGKLVKAKQPLIEVEP